MKKIIGLLTLLVSLIALAPPASAVEVTPRIKMAVIGDSLVSQMCSHQNEAIPTRRVQVYDVGCLGWSGATSGGVWRRTIEPNWVDPLNTIPPTNSIPFKQALDQANVIVVGLGTNNALRRQPTDWYGWDIDNIMSVAAGRKVIWFDTGMRVWPGSLGNWDQWKSATLHNEVLWAKTTQYPNLTVLPWGGTISDSKYVLSDGVHLTDAGYLKRWEMVKNAI